LPIGLYAEPNKIKEIATPEPRQNHVLAMQQKFN